MTNAHYERGSVDPGGCIRNAWELIKQRYWMYVGISFLTFIITGYLYCISWFVMGPIMGGVFYVALRDMRGEPVDFGMMFKGFEKFVPLMIVGLVQSIPRILSDIISLFANVAQIAMLPMAGSGDSDFFQSSQPDFSGLPFAITGITLVIILIVALVFMILAVIWHIAFLCVVPLVLEHDMSPMDAIKLSIQAGFSNIGGLFVLMILESLILFASFLLICIGLFFIGFPIMFVANAFAYRMIFPYVERQINIAPPPPSEYGFGGGQPAY